MNSDLKKMMRAMIHAWLWALLVMTASARQPNVIWILADDLGYGELGCYGQKVIQTPRIDAMAREGMRFTHFYSGATVCAPSRSVLMTGLHQGHTRIRGNGEPDESFLTSEDLTVAKVLQRAGYRTAVLGKWGLGEYGGAEQGLPKNQGFDEFFGYLNHRHAHNHYPAFLWRNESKQALQNEVVAMGPDGAGYATKAVEYADDLFAEEALRFVEKQQKQPFFLYWSLVSPHANNESARALGNGAVVPDFGPYADESWPLPDRGHAAMITRIDGYVGRMLDHLAKLGLEKDTLVIFTSDNGPHNESRHSLERFQPSGPFTGIKRSLTDGGIRVPMIAWWPGKIKAAGQTAHVGSFVDAFATLSELAGVTSVPKNDGISFLPTLLGTEQRQHEFLYWEFHEQGFQQAALYQARWKGIRSGGKDRPIVLYDLQNDVAEKTDVAKAHPELAKKISDYLQSARTPSAMWQPKWKK